MAAVMNLSSLGIKLTKGNELTSFVTEDFSKGMFQTALVDGLDTDKANRVRNTVAALGCRGDYMDLVAYADEGEAGAIPDVDTIYIEVVDYTGVPVAVQHTIFGKYSPFVGPKEPMNESMMDGIDRQEMAVINSEVIADEGACSTGKTQKVRGSLDSRITYLANHADIESATETYLRFTPNSDGVFMIRAGARIWAHQTIG
jgi:hypothetical protein